MIDYESLLEFEESLRSSSLTGSLILLNNLELKIECARLASLSDDVCLSALPEFTNEDMDQLYSNYRISDDEFNTCSKCGRSLELEELYQSCCKAFVKNSSSISSKLEASFWLAFINNPTRTINTLPHYTEFLCLQQGVPNQLRSKVWEKLFLLNTNEIPQASMLVYNNFQHSYNSEISDQISKDLNRTFPTVNFFKKEDTIQNLSTILNVYANYDAELGYCQGLLFLVGVLYYHFHGNSELTFHCLITIMESEVELHDIFTAPTMSDTLNLWHNEFLDVLKATDKELHDHLTSFVELQVFLYQWWLSFMSSHSPDLSIVNRVMDFCIIQGWKTGLFKISLGLLVINKPIIMSLDKGDEEVIYQHLLNESKWGNVINDLDLFFGDLLLKWDESLFINEYQAPVPQSAHQSNEEKSSSLVGRIFSHSRTGQNSNNHNNELESIYSDISEVSSNEPGKSFADYLKLPYLTKRMSDETNDTHLTTSNQLMVENHTLKALLKKAYTMIDQDLLEAATLKNEISKIVDVAQC
ncbi:uncharacterized protein CANTADRAFT_305081 [Suhomyces tanzawaensis NRRL Y-17324]|uniref:Rab-GAP TBC domain-containing protein n=1 Tax=Suhomyces tanzawaensis NRRL Y-17324 TaxID=984487 RepID=A0A1E4SCU0_9ASCO|nr:uncharacterized protein CANTADRAFT_305081 [Suhomyces tanzawaensis NRRL Y-17324]ODV77315.1 hypothetical protein CANTADRAFT_305081 [Suhomyces tanzawaensis NRRL Y-17324]